MLIFVTISSAELPAQRYSDEDWLRLGKGLKTTPGDNTVLRPKPDPPGAGPATTSPATTPDSMQLRILRYACALGAPPSLVLQIADDRSRQRILQLSHARPDLGQPSHATRPKRRAKLVQQPA